MEYRRGKIGALERISNGWIFHPQRSPNLDAIFVESPEKLLILIFEECGIFWNGSFDVCVTIKEQLAQDIKAALDRFDNDSEE